MGGWIKLYRDMKSWEWYQDVPVKVLFLHILLEANHSPTRYQGIELKAGQFITTMRKLCVETGLSKQQIQTALKKLENTGEINKQSRNKNTLITVENWGIYQLDNSDSNTISRNEQETSNKQTRNEQDTNRIRNKELKNDNNINNIYMLGEFENVKLSEEELERLKDRFPYDWQEWIERVSSYKQSKGKRYKSDYATILNWARKENKSPLQSGASKREIPKLGVDI